RVRAEAADRRAEEEVERNAGGMFPGRSEATRRTRPAARRVQSDCEEVIRAFDVLRSNCAALTEASARGVYRRLRGSITSLLLPWLRVLFGLCVFGDFLQVVEVGLAEGAADDFEVEVDEVNEFRVTGSEQVATELLAGQATDALASPNRADGVLAAVF